MCAKGIARFFKHGRKNKLGLSCKSLVIHTMEKTWRRVESQVVTNKRTFPLRILDSGLFCNKLAWATISMNSHSLTK